jgi:hypothetical protein
MQPYSPELVAPLPGDYLLIIQRKSDEHVSYGPTAVPVRIIDAGGGTKRIELKRDDVVETAEFTELTDAFVFTITTPIKIRIEEESLDNLTIETFTASVEASGPKGRREYSGTYLCLYPPIRVFGMDRKQIAGASLVQGSFTLVEWPKEQTEWK